MEYQYDQWIKQKWTTETRYYIVEVRQDMFGTWLVESTWGSRSTKLGNNKQWHVDTHEKALSILESIKKRRIVRGYAIDQE